MGSDGATVAEVTDVAKKSGVRNELSMPLLPRSLEPTNLDSQASSLALNATGYASTRTLKTTT